MNLASLTNHIGQRNLGGHLHRLSRVLSVLSEHRWAREGYPDMRSAHVQLLRHLDPEGTRSTVLAQRAQVTKQTMSRLVQELTAHGYVALSPDPADSRAARVQLTARGQAFLQYLAGALVDLEQAFGKVLGPARLADFTAATQELLAFAEKRQQELG